MSAFKRRQSKVFWNQMQDLDIGNDLCSNDTQNSPHFEDSLNSSKDTTDDANVTVIRRDNNINDRCGELPKSHRETSHAEEKKVENSCCARSGSPLSQGHRSQDSGFSDSDRSECSDGEARPRQRRSRRRGRIRGQLNIKGARINSFCNPAHTSTPKQDPKSMERDKNLARQHADISKTRWDLRQLDCAEENNKGTSILRSCYEDTLVDFLFSEEPSADTSLFLQSSRSSLAIQSLITESVNGSSSMSNGYEEYYNRLAPVKDWLQHISHEVEDECGMLLFHKSLPKPVLDDDSERNNLSSLTSSATAAVAKLLLKADKFDQRFNAILKKLADCGNVRVEKELIQLIEDDARKFLLELKAPPPRRIHQGNSQSIIQQSQYMKADIEQVLETRLDTYVEQVVSILEESLSEDNGVVRGTLAALTALGMSGVRAGRSIARCSGVRNLLAFLLSTLSFSSELRCMALRALECVCSCPEAIEAFAKEDGPEIIADILASASRPESEKTEVAALIVQISAPWSDSLGIPHLAIFADSFVRDLTELARKTKCSQTLLLTAAALNYLSRNGKFVAPTLEHDTVRILLKCVKRSAGGNVCLMEQVASLIGQLARHPSTFSHLAKAGVSVALISFIRMRPPHLKDSYKKLKVTASTALNRLCVDSEITNQVIELGGIDCLSIYDGDGEEGHNCEVPKVAPAKPPRQNSGPNNGATSADGFII